MGLDMYLYRTKFADKLMECKITENGILKDYRVNLEPGSDKKVTIQELTEAENEALEEKYVNYVTTEIMYWRKFHRLHYWFVKNCPDAFEDGSKVYVPLEMLYELSNIMSKLAKKLHLDKNGDVKNWELLESLLPIRDEWCSEYEYDLICSTAKTLQEILKTPDCEEYDYYYEYSV